MFVQKIVNKIKDKSYTNYLIIENYREGKNVKHRTIANISKLPPYLIDSIKKSLKAGKALDDISNLGQGKSFGAIKVVSEIAKKLGITDALGNSRQANLALLQIAGRIICQQSRNYIANEWVKNQAVNEVFHLNNFTEDTLYENLNWLSENQKKIEKKIFDHRTKNGKAKSIYLYDVTSSYFEGMNNELGQYGYNRDKKSGKKQIVIGLLTDDSGLPVSIEVFKGNTNDTKTVSSQLNKLQTNFGVERVIFVGDKGMIKSAQIEEIKSENYKWNYLTSITKEQIKTLINKDIIQLSMFDDNLVEVENDGIRYIMRRNELRSVEIMNSRNIRIEKIKKFVADTNQYLSEHKKASPDVALKNLNKKISQYKLKSILEGFIENSRIDIRIDEQQLEKSSDLDGCYVLKTDVPKEEMSMQTAQKRYKELSGVEFAFRTMKTTIEEVRPIYLRKAERTRGHVFVVMLAYMIVKFITDALEDLAYSRKFIIESLDKISYVECYHEGKSYPVLPVKLQEHQQKIIDRLGIKLM